MSSAAASGAPPTAAIGADDANNPTTKNAATVVDVDESPPLFATASSFPGADDASLNDEEWLSRCLLYTSPSPRDLSTSRMPSSA